MKKRYLVLFASLMMLVATGCQKGEEVTDTAPEIASLFIGNYDFAQLELLSNGQPAFARSTQLFKIFSGKNTLSIVLRETGDTLFEQEFDIRRYDTLFMLRPSEHHVSLLRSNQGSEPPPREGHIKVKLMNFTTLAPEGQPVNLEFRQTIGYDWDNGGELYSDKADTIFNVTNATETYAELAAPDVPDFGNFGGFRVTFLNTNNQPILKDGIPVHVSFAPEGYLAPDGSWMYPARIYTSYVTDNDIYSLGTHWSGQFVHLFLN